MPETWNHEPITDADIRKRLERPARGTAKAAHRARHAKADDREARNKTTVRKRDSYRSRWPDDDGQPLEVAHLTHKGMAGDINTERSKPELMILVSWNVHQGPRSLHSGHLRVRFLTAEKANGPLVFYEKVGPALWREVARELWPGMLAPKREAQ